MNGSLLRWCLSVSSAVRLSVFEILLEMWIKKHASAATPALRQPVDPVVPCLRLFAKSPFLSRLLVKQLLKNRFYRFQFSRAQCHKLPDFFSTTCFNSPVSPVPALSFLNYPRWLNAAKLDTLDVKDKKKRRNRKTRYSLWNSPPWRIVTLLVSLYSTAAPPMTQCVLPPRNVLPRAGFIVSLHSSAQRDAAGSSDPFLAQSRRWRCPASAHSGWPVRNVPLGHCEYVEQ